LGYYHFTGKELVADLDKRFGGSKPKMESERMPENRCARRSCAMRIKASAWNRIRPRTVFIKSEVDALAALRPTEEASLILGYKEKVPVTVARLAATGIIPALRIGRGWRFKDKDLLDYLRDKRLGRLRLALRVKADSRMVEAL